VVLLALVPLISNAKRELTVMDVLPTNTSVLMMLPVEEGQPLPLQQLLQPATATEYVNPPNQKTKPTPQTTARQPLKGMPMVSSSLHQPTSGRTKP